MSKTRKRSGIRKTPIVPRETESQGEQTFLEVLLECERSRPPVPRARTILDLTLGKVYIDEGAS